MELEAGREGGREGGWSGGGVGACCIMTFEGGREEGGRGIFVI